MGITKDEIEENKQLQEEERLAVCAIYGDNILKLDEQNTTEEQQVYSLTLNVDQDELDNIDSTITTGHLKSPRIIVLRIFFPSTYPSQDIPVFEMTSMYCGNKKIDSDMINNIEDGFKELFQPGLVVLFEWIQWLREYILDNVQQQQINNNDTITLDENIPLQSLNINDYKKNDDQAKNKTSSIPNNNNNNNNNIKIPSIYSSEPLIDRKSTFIAHVATVHNTEEVELVMSTLLQNKKIAKATHNIMAYRINLSGDRILQDNDDDGETAAGGRLMHLLQILEVKNVIVVVSRWFGGVLLGADRFKDINNVARLALEDCGYVQQNDHTNHQSNTKKKGKK